MRRALRRSGPRVPERERFGDVRVLDGPALPGEPLPERRARASKRTRTNRGWSVSPRPSRPTHRRPAGRPLERRRRQPILRARAVNRRRRRRLRRTRPALPIPARATRQASPRSAVRCVHEFLVMLAGSVAASFATTRSPGRSTSSQFARGICVTSRPILSTSSSLAPKRVARSDDPQRSSQRLRVRCAPGIGHRWSRGQRREARHRRRRPPPPAAPPPPPPPPHRGVPAHPPSPRKRSSMPSSRRCPRDQR